MKSVQATLIFYESPKRLAAALADMAAILGDDRQAVVCRELTKRFEELRRGTLADLARAYAVDEVRGEIVVLVDRAKPVVADEASIAAALNSVLGTMSVKDASTFVSQSLGLPRKIVYQTALALTKG